MYQVTIPTWGWRREKIEDGKDWLGNLANPTILVEQAIDNTHRLSVTLEETRTGVEVFDAELLEWMEDENAPNGGYWVPGQGVSASKIKLI